MSRRWPVACLLPALLLATGCFTKQGIVMPWTVEHQSLARKLDSLYARVEQLDTSQRSALTATRADLSSQLAATGERVDIVSAKLDDYVARQSRLTQRLRPTPDTTAKPADNAAAVYDQARNDYTTGKFDIARQEFGEFLKQFPDNALASNAQYWLAECYYGRQQFDTARVEFQKVVEHYPESEKVPSARVKLGLCFENLGDKTAAAAQYESVIKQFPSTPEAGIARDNLRRLQQ